jgi:hypothetical protein
MSKNSRPAHQVFESIINPTNVPTILFQKYWSMEAGAELDFPELVRTTIRCGKIKRTSTSLSTG